MSNPTNGNTLMSSSSQPILHIEGHTRTKPQARSPSGSSAVSSPRAPARKSRRYKVLGEKRVVLQNMAAIPFLQVNTSRGEEKHGTPVRPPLTTRVLLAHQASSSGLTTTKNTYRARHLLNFSAKRPIKIAAVPKTRNQSGPEPEGTTVSSRTIRHAARLSDAGNMGHCGTICDVVDSGCNSTRHNSCLKDRGRMAAAPRRVHLVREEGKKSRTVDARLAHQKSVINPGIGALLISGKAKPAAAKRAARRASDLMLHIVRAPSLDQPLQTLPSKPPVNYVQLIRGDINDRMRRCPRARC